MNLQVYTAQCVEYSGGFFIGNKNDEPTKTLLSFFIASLFGGYEDLICFIPVTNLTSDKLLGHFHQVGRALHGIGFQILPVVTDGLRTNQRFFKELSGGCIGIPITNPFLEEQPMFLIFDTVHLMKTLYNNFQKRRFNII